MSEQLLAELGAALPDYHWRYRDHSDTYVGMSRTDTTWLSLWWERGGWYATVSAAGPERPPERGPLPVDLARAVHLSRQPEGRRVSDRPRVTVVQTSPRFFTLERVAELVEAHPTMSWGLALFMDGAVGKTGRHVLVLSVDRFGLFARIEGADRDEDSVFRGKTMLRCVELALASPAWALLNGAERAREAS